ncbi:hypothetical protein ACP70R_037710 [Stipagrostis hirtigluma subsp. patula]
MGDPEDSQGRKEVGDPSQPSAGRTATKKTGTSGEHASSSAGTPVPLLDATAAREVEADVRGLGRSRRTRNHG